MEWLLHEEPENNPDARHSIPPTPSKPVETNKALKALKERGFIAQCSSFEDLSGEMDKGPITFYVGCDPTAASLHIGHMVPFFAFRHLCEAGNRGIALIGEGTARIGDPSGRTQMRQIVSYDKLEKNAEAIRAQLGSFLAGIPNDKVVFANNKDWLAKLNYIEFLREIGSHFSVNRMLSFEAYKQRLEKGLSFIEFNYQLLQSYDFLKLNMNYTCRLQIGGDDQWGNIVAGLELIRRLKSEWTSGDGAFEGKSAGENVDREPCFGLTFPLIETSDGKKMGKTEKGALFLDPDRTPPYEFFQYWRNAGDADVHRFLLLFTFLSVEECQALAKLPNPNEAKERLAYEITALIHGKDEAEKALKGGRAAFGGGADRDAMPNKRLERARLDAGYPVVELFFDAGLCKTKSEARRLVEYNGAGIMTDGAFKCEALIETLIYPDRLDKDGSLLIRAGKKRVMRLTFE